MQAELGVGKIEVAEWCNAISGGDLQLFVGLDRPGRSLGVGDGNQFCLSRSARAADQ